MDSQRFNLTRGGITGRLLAVSLPIIGTQLMLTGYNLVDMFLLGRVGADAVAASGTAGLYMWLASGAMSVGRMGAEIGVAQSKGAGNKGEAHAYSRNSLLLAIALGGAYAFICLAFAPQLIGFLKVREPAVAEDAVRYLFLVALGMPAVFVSASIAGTFTGSGNSRVPFLVNTLGLGMNILLDPLFIFTLEMGVAGAAVATTLSQITGCALSVYWLLRKRDRPFPHYSLLARPGLTHIRRILGWTVPIAAESMLFTFFLMVLTRHVATYGAHAIAVYRVGTQVESLCYLVCQGFSSGITAFVGQNFGAGEWPRIRAGVRKALEILLVWSGLVTFLFLFAGRLLTALFIPEKEIAEMGAAFPWILAFCQPFTCFEAVGAGALRGLGRTIPPSVASIVSNGLRIPLAYFLSGTELGLNGIWWAITIGAIARGGWVYGWFRVTLMREK